MTLEVTSVNELKEIASEYNQGYIFRGQTSHYLTKDGKPSITTSFNRNGCIPPLMQKWDFYCRETLLALKGPEWDGSIELEECQAVLQHYGWRSFFIDFSSDFTVAAWFGSHKYSDNFCADIVEDWQEIGLMAFHRSVKYESSSDEGYLYIVSNKILLDLDVSSFELGRFKFRDFDSRFDRQKAVMVGPLSILPEEAIVEVLEVPTEVLIEFSKGLTQKFLFPDRNQDLIYKLLLDVPYGMPKSIDPSLGEFGPYVRDLEIPEYDYKFTKHIHPNIAFYQARFLLENKAANTDPGVIIRAPDSFLYHTEVRLGDDIDGVISLMGDSSILTIETDGILNLPTYGDSATYLKGAVIERISDEIICISGLMIKHPGLTYTEIRADHGWHYKLVDGKFTRKIIDADCPCNNYRKHMLEASIVKKIQYAIANNSIKLEDGYHVVTEEGT